MDAYQKFSFLDSIEMNNPQLKNGKGKQAKAYQKIKQELSAQPNKKNKSTNSSKRRERKKRQQLVKKKLKKSGFKKDKCNLDKPINTVGHFQGRYFARQDYFDTQTTSLTSNRLLHFDVLPIHDKIKWPRYFEFHTNDQHKQFVCQHHRGCNTDFNMVMT